METKRHETDGDAVSEPGAARRQRVEDTCRWLESGSMVLMHDMAHDIRAAIAELEAELDALRDVCRELTGKDWNWQTQPREEGEVS